MKNKIPGGLADSNTPADFNDTDLAKGVKVELEHTSDKHIAMEIAMDHIKEDPKYYDKLEVMEKSAFWNEFYQKQAASSKIKGWLSSLKKRSGGVERFIRRSNIKGFSKKSLNRTSDGRSLR